MTISEQIIQVLDALCEKFGIVIDWTNANVIPYLEVLCSKLIAYEIGTSIAWMAIMILVSVGCMVATKRFYPAFKNGIENQEYCEIGWSVGSVCAIIGLVIIYLSTIIVCGVQIMDIIKCTTFSEMYIVEYIQRLC